MKDLPITPSGSPVADLWEDIDKSDKDLAGIDELSSVPLKGTSTMMRSQIFVSIQI